MIRAMWLFGPFNNCIFHWRGAANEGKVPLESLENEFLPKLFSGSMNKVRREMEIEGNIVVRAHLQDRALTICMHKGFLMVADADSHLDLEAVKDRLGRSISDGIIEDPLAFGQLCDSDTPAKAKLMARFQSILESQYGKRPSSPR
jgi:hypothetical protein